MWQWASVQILINHSEAHADRVDIQLHHPTHPAKRLMPGIYAGR